MSYFLLTLLIAVVAFVGGFIFRIWMEKHFKSTNKEGNISK